MAHITDEELADYLAMKKARELGIVTKEDHFPGIPVKRYRKPWEGIDLRVHIPSSHHGGHMSELQSHTAAALATPRLQNDIHKVNTAIQNKYHVNTHGNYSTHTPNHYHEMSSHTSNRAHEINTYHSTAKYLNAASELSKKAMRRRK